MMCRHGTFCSVVSTFYVLTCSCVLLRFLCVDASMSQQFRMHFTKDLCVYYTAYDLNDDQLLLFVYCNYF